MGFLNWLTRVFCIHLIAMQIVFDAYTRLNITFRVHHPPSTQ